jgi:hypothetical protein
MGGELAEFRISKGIQRERAQAVGACHIVQVDFPEQAWRENEGQAQGIFLL